MNNYYDLEKLYAKLGKEYYEGKFEDPLPELLPVFDQITRAKQAMYEVKREPVCPRCGVKIDAGDMFCGNCGERLK